MGDPVSKEVDSDVEDNTCGSVPTFIHPCMYTQASVHLRRKEKQRSKWCLSVERGDLALHFPSSQLSCQALCSHLGRDALLLDRWTHFTFSKVIEASKEWGQHFDNSPTANYNNYKTIHLKGRILPIYKNILMKMVVFYKQNEFIQVTLPYILSIAFSIFPTSSYMARVDII